MTQAKQKTYEIYEQSTESEVFKISAEVSKQTIGAIVSTASNVSSTAFIHADLLSGGALNQATAKA